MYTPKIALAAAFAVGSLVYAEQASGPADRQINATPAAGVQVGQSDHQYHADKDKDKDKDKKLTDRDFVKKAASSGLYEIESARLASEKLDSEQHKQHAQRIMQDHQRASEQLKQIAQQKNIEVASSMDEKHEEKISKLREKSGEEFSKEFAQQQVKAHKAAIKLHEKAAADLDDQQLKQFAQQQLPVLQEHLAMLQADHAHALIEMDSDFDDAQPAGARIGGEADREHRIDINVQDRSDTLQRSDSLQRNESDLSQPTPVQPDLGR